MGADNAGVEGLEHRATPEGCSRLGAAPDSGGRWTTLRVAPEMPSVQLGLEERPIIKAYVEFAMIHLMLRPACPKTRMPSSTLVRRHRPTCGTDTQELVARCRPHVVHLSGHGTVDRDGMGSFAFEARGGQSDSREAATIVAEVFRGGHHGVRCVFFDSYQTSQAATAGLYQVAGDHRRTAGGRLVGQRRRRPRHRLRRGVLPLACPPRSRPSPTAHARELVRGEGLVRHGMAQFQDPTFALPKVYASAADGSLYDPRLPPERGRPADQLRPARRRDQGPAQGVHRPPARDRRLVPALHDGGIDFAVLTGIGGAGKSTLATRATNRLESTASGPCPFAQRRSRPRRVRPRPLVRLVGELDDAWSRPAARTSIASSPTASSPSNSGSTWPPRGWIELRWSWSSTTSRTSSTWRPVEIADAKFLAVVYRRSRKSLTHGAR